MSQALINTGAFPNDATGDPLQTAFNKINSNFGQLFGTSSGVTFGPPPTPPGGTPVTIIGATPAVLPALAVTGQVSIAGPFPASGVALAIGGATTIATPTVGTGLIVNGLSGNYAEQVSGSSSVGNSFGLLINGGTNSVDAALNVASQSLSHSFLTLFGDGHFVTGWNGSTNSLVGSAAGNITINTPASGATLQVNGIAGQNYINAGSSLDLAPLITITGSAASKSSFELNVTGTQAVEFMANFSGSADSFGMPNNSYGIFGFNNTGNLVFGNNAHTTLSLSGTGNATIATPTSGTALTVNTPAATTGINIVQGGAGGNALTWGITGHQGLLYATSGGIQIGSFTNDSFQIFVNNGSPALTVGTAGNVTIAAPTSSNTAFTANGITANYAMQAAGAATSGNSYGLLITAGTTAADQAFAVLNQGAVTPFLRVFGDGGTVMGNPTGGDKGAGTLNCTGLFVNGVAVTVP